MADVALPMDKQETGFSDNANPTPTEPPAPEMSDEQLSKEVFGDIPETVGEGTTTEGVEVPEVKVILLLMQFNRLQIQDRDKAKVNLDVFTEIVAEMESDKNPQAKNPKSTAAGLFRIQNHHL